MTPDTQRIAAPRPLRKDAERNRQRIIAAAREVFRERGFEATLDDVAHHAGLGVGTVYRRFPNKEQLIESMFADRMTEIIELAKKTLADPDPWHGFVGFLEKVVELMAADRGMHDMMVSTAFGHEQVAQIRDQLMPLGREIVQRAKDSGELRADFEVEDVVVLLKMCGAVATYIDHMAPGIWRRYFTLLIDSLRGRPGDPTPLPHPALTEEMLRQAMDCPP
ncbi:TetR/AcrR family transcriptional regulator [Amycolatopsis sp. K13G38]|uniref:TetR/AcrR family transcriptional regulator n=1 Tax=Amycolatopsis acididurans TaxID=2724524 RepID=A0ABX1JG69_9PSEU|nr:TetR/AcrR family transcriptional regulator [Amycolatopsis acididurans]NKQ57511.1 TetR/AcrR family transcriptional regulator [Amycolatopsis acididurans]